MAFEPGAAPRILILRRDNIGDLACTTPLIAGLRERWPRAWLGALVNTYNAEVLARNPALDEVFAYEKLKHRSGSLWSFLVSRYRQAARLREGRLDAVLVPAPSAQAIRIAAGLRPAQVVASPLDFPDGIHEVQRTFDLGRRIGLDGVPGPMQVFPEERRVRELKAVLGEGPVIALHISARRPAQKWPLEHYAALATELSSSTRVMLLWAPGSRDDPRHPGDDEAAKAVLAQVKGMVLPVPTPDLASLVAALHCADLVICPDGGALHLAAASGKPVVALFGDSPVARWRPWGVPHRVVRPESGDLKDLQLEPVLDAVRALRA